MHLHRGNLFLVGLPGAGKSTLGRQLARRLGKTFIDADAELERKLGVTIATIFEIEGEASFRDREEAALIELAAMTNIVLATGGGVVIRVANRDRLRANPVLPAAPPETLRCAPAWTFPRTPNSHDDPRTPHRALHRAGSAVPRSRRVCSRVRTRRDRPVRPPARDRAAERARRVNMHTVDVALGERSYPIHVGPDLLSRAGTLAPRLPRPRVLSNPIVAALWLDPLRQSFAAVTSIAAAFPDSEANKTLATLSDLLTRCRQAERRPSLRSAAVSSAISGFAAAIYQRGCARAGSDTLLAQVTSVGKTGKPRGCTNMVGAFTATGDVRRLICVIACREAPVAHAIETGIGYGEWLHGEAVAAGMVMAAKLSARIGWIADDDIARLAALLENAGLPIVAPRMEVGRWLELLGRDKKVDRGQVRLVLLRALGRAVITADFDSKALEAVLHA